MLKCILEIAAVTENSLSLSNLSQEQIYLFFFRFIF